MKKILIIGHTGFVGKNLFKYLLDFDYKIEYGSRVSGLDLCDYDTIINYLLRIKPDVIVNCASYGGSVHYVDKHHADVININTQMSLNLYQAISEVYNKEELKNNVLVINLFSNCSYPAYSNVQKESEWLKEEPHSSVYSFAWYKRFLYALSNCYLKQYSIHSKNLMLPNAYGPNDTIDPDRTHALNGMIIRMCYAKKNNSDEFIIWGSGNPVREWIYVDDICKIIKNEIDIGRRPIIYPINIAQNKGYSIKETALIIQNILQYVGKISFDTNYQDGDPIKILDNSKFRIQYYDYNFENFRDGIRKTIEYYRHELEI